MQYLDETVVPAVPPPARARSISELNTSELFVLTYDEIVEFGFDESGSIGYCSPCATGASCVPDGGE